MVWPHRPGSLLSRISWSIVSRTGQIIQHRLLTHTITHPLVKLVTYGLSVMILNSLNFCISNSVYMLFWPNGCRLLSDLMGRHRNILLDTSLHALLTFINFCYLFILWPLSRAASTFSWYRSCIVCSGLAYEIYSGGSPFTYVYCVVCYCVIAAPYVRSVGRVFKYIYTLDDDLERPMDHETSLLPKVFPLSSSVSISLCTLSITVSGLWPCM